jgi:transposase
MVDRELRRRRWLINRKLEGWRSTEIATALRIDERTVYRWWRVYRKHGWAGLNVKSHKPHTIHRTSQETVELILQLRRARNWGQCRIEGYLRNYNKQSIASHTTIHKILNQAGLNNPIPKPRRTWRKHRFQREHGNSLWQGDYKLTENDEWMISFLDDHSRFIPGSRTHHNPTAKHAITLLEESISQYGKPEQVLTDRGTQFYPARGGISEFTQFCTGNGIQHIVTSVRRPSTIGKIEAFHKAYVCESWMFPSHRGFIHYWNYERPHQGIRYLYPAGVYFHDICG